MRGGLWALTAAQQHHRPHPERVAVDPGKQTTEPAQVSQVGWRARLGSARLRLPRCVSLLSRHRAGGLISFSLLPCSNQGNRKAFGGSSAQTHTWGGGGSCGHLRSHQPAQPFVQDPAMPPLPPPNTLSQLEEACRRLEEVSTKTTKQRCADASADASASASVS